MLPLAHAPAWRAASLALVLTVIYGSLGVGAHVPGFGGHDKLQHFAVYCFLTVWFTGLIARRRYWLVALALVALGLGMEYLQSRLRLGRQGDPYDMLANALGIATGIARGWWKTGTWALRIEAWLARR